MRKVHTGVLAGISALAAAGVAHASFIPTFGGTTAGPGSDTTFNYDLVFSTSGTPAVQELRTGDFLTIYDIPGFVSATPPANFSASVQNIGVTAFGTAPGDDAGLPNVTFRYTGAAPITVDSVFAGAQIVSNFAGLGQDYFTGQTTRTSDSTAIGHIGLVTVPIPEPGTLMFLGALPLALMRRR